MDIQPYEHKTQYYETDQMGIIHHSNYIRWFEEARVDIMDQIGIGYGRMEEEGVVSPVLSISCQYKSMTRFGDVVSISTEIVKYDGIRLHLEYVVTDKLTGEVRCIGESKHCFLGKEGTPISLKRDKPEFDGKFRAI